uniref:Regulator of ribonuclease activity homolog n=1 Tax=Steinernema glaseri TaxID=37863 RepID=A0A1I7YM61_9BILA
MLQRSRREVSRCLREVSRSRGRGAPVCAGDLVVADEDGVIIIPVAAVERTLREGRQRADKEALLMARLREGHTTLDLLGLTRPQEQP